ncbi:hypothetical protein ONZ45_g6490 [Pleurotus djamor]|nr:hypothetical protein ONZ45_g6490 [Pleurotus djamor]
MLTGTVGSLHGDNIDEALPGFSLESNMTSTLVADLPDELLTMIFENLPLGLKTTNAQKVLELNGLRQSFFVCTHVCRRWRHILISVPSFWDTIYVFMEKELAELFSERAGPTLPLRLLNDERAHRWNGATIGYFIQNHSSRIRELEVNPDRSAEATDLISSITQPNLPMLEHLTIVRTFSWGSFQFFPATESGFETSAIRPVLRYLHLQEFLPQNIHSPLFSQLSFLKIQFELGNIFRLGLTYLLHTLGGMVHLQVLDLKEIISPDVPHTQTPTLTILPSLTSLVLEEDLHILEVFLRHVSCPHVISARMHAPPYGQADSAHLTSAVAGFLALIPTEPRDWHSRLVLAPNTGSYWTQAIHIYPQREYERGEGEILPGSPPFKFSITQQNGSGLWQSFMRVFPAGAPRIATLQFNRPHDLKSFDWVFHPPETYIKTLLVDSLPTCEGLLLGEGPYRETSEVYYPSIEHVIWVPYKGVDGEDMLDAGSILRERESKGLAVKKLTIVCTPEDHELVTDMAWFQQEVMEVKLVESVPSLTV